MNINEIIRSHTEIIKDALNALSGYDGKQQVIEAERVKSLADTLYKIVMDKATGKAHRWTS